MGREAYDVNALGNLVFIIVSKKESNTRISLVKHALLLDAETTLLTALSISILALIISPIY
jgi:hypothetical protein